MSKVTHIVTYTTQSGITGSQLVSFDNSETWGHTSSGGKYIKTWNARTYSSRDDNMYLCSYTSGKSYGVCCTSGTRRDALAGVIKETIGEPVKVDTIRIRKI